MRFVIMALAISIVSSTYGMEWSNKFDSKSDIRTNDLVLYKEPKPIKMPSLEKRLHMHSDVLIISGIIIYGMYTVLTYPSYPPYSYFDR